MIRIPGNTRFHNGVLDRQHFVHASEHRDFFVFPPDQQALIKGLDDGVEAPGA